MRRESRFSLEKDYWILDFYDKAITMIDKKIPIFIPSYHRGHPGEAKFFNALPKMSEPWPIYVIVRKTEEAIYKETYKDYNFVTIVGMEDNRIDDCGKAKRGCVDTANSLNYDDIFLFDDDIKVKLFSMAYDTTNTSNRKMFYAREYDDLTKLLAMWQLIHLNFKNKYNKYLFSALAQDSYNFAKEYGEDNSYAVSGNAFNGALCIDLSKCKYLNLNFRSNKQYGSEDLDMVLRALEKGYFNIGIRILCRNADAMAVAPNVCNNVQSSLDYALGYANTRERMNALDKRNIFLHGNSKYAKINTDHHSLEVNKNSFLKQFGLQKFGSLRKELYEPYIK